MSFICVICRDLLKISEDEPYPQQQQPLPNSSITSNNNVSGRKKEKNNSIVATKCGHLFHYPCLSVWLSQSMNLTTDSKMRCPSCKQLIYIYELIQLFPVENGCSKDLGHLFSTTFHEKVKGLLEQLENLCRDLNKKNNEISSPSKGNETPTRLQRIKDSPKKSQASQIAHLMKETDSLRSSIKELNSFIEQHAELGTIVEKQSKEISVLTSKNELLIVANERLKSVEIENTDKDDNSTAVVVVRNTPEYSQQQNKQNDDGNVQSTLDNNATKEITTTTKTAQDLQIKNTTAVSSPSVSNNSNRRKSVTFLDPFDEYDDDDAPRRKMTNESIPFECKDFRVGDKVVWKFEGIPEVGTVKWKGFIGSQINVGVEFDRQLGLPIKDLSSDLSSAQCIFKCKPGHGRLIPVQQVVLYDKGMISNCSLMNSNYSDRVQCDGTKTHNHHKRIAVCTHQ